MAGQGLFLAFAISIVAAISEGHKQRFGSNVASSNGLHVKRTRFHDSKHSQLRHRQQGKASDGEHLSNSFSRNRIPGKCVGGKMRWWIAIKKKCQKSYGAESKWDRSRLDGWCRQAWSSCNTPAYTSCCTQPKGPEDLGAYCDDPDDADAQGDVACTKVAPQVDGLKDLANELQNSIKNTEEPLSVKVSLAPAPAPAAGVGASGPAPAVGGPAAAAAEDTEDAIDDAEDAIGVAGSTPPPGLEKNNAEVVATFDDLPEEELENRCDQIEGLVKKAQRRFKNMEKIMGSPPPKAGDFFGWFPSLSFKGSADAKKGILLQNGSFLQDQAEHQVSKTEPVLNEDLFRTDPDLAWHLSDLLRVGSRILKEDPSAYCSQVNLGGGMDDEDIWVNETKLWELLEWVSALEDSLHNIDTQVHPRGLKWWRYRWEYTVLESGVLVIQLAILHLVMYIMFYLSSAYARKYHKTGVPRRFFRYTTDYFFSHAAATGLVTFGMWMFREITPLYDWIATTVRGHTEGYCVSPLMGASYYFLNMGVLYQIFIAYLMYAAALLLIQEQYVKALMDWRALADMESPGLVPSPRSDEKDIAKHNRELWTVYSSIVKRNVESGHDKYLQLFQKYGLRLPDRNSRSSSDEKVFKLHLLLTDALGESMEFLTEVSLKTMAYLCFVALVIGIFAIHFKLAFMYLLIPFVMLGIFVLGVGWSGTAYWRKKHEAGEKVCNAYPSFLNLHVFCRVLQIVLLWIFFSFSRLLFSFDIWKHYFHFGVLAVGLLALFMAFLYFHGAEAIKQTVGILVLPPHVVDARFERLLDLNVRWQTIPTCPEFGTDNLPAEYSPSVAWATTTRGFDKQDTHRRPGMSNRV